MNMFNITGKYNNEIPADSRLSMSKYNWLFKEFSKTDAFEKARKISVFAEGIGIPMAKMALAWCLKNPNVSTVITGASRVEQVHENMKALEVVDKITSDVMERIEGILQNNPKE